MLVTNGLTFCLSELENMRPNYLTEKRCIYVFLNSVYPAYFQLQQSSWAAGVRGENTLRLFFLCVWKGPLRHIQSDKQTLLYFLSTFRWSIHPLGLRSSPTVFCQILLSSSSLHRILLSFLLYHLFDTCSEGVKWSHLSVCQSERSLGGEGERAGRDEGHLKGNHEHICFKTVF